MVDLASKYENTKSSQDFASKFLLRDMQGMYQHYSPAVQDISP